MWVSPRPPVRLYKTEAVLSTATWRLPGQGRIRFGIQGVELGYGRDGRRETGQAGGSAPERAQGYHGEFEAGYRTSTI